MIEVIRAARPANDAIQAEAEILMRSEHGDPIADGSLEQLAEESLYNEQQRAAIQAELDALATATGQQKVTRQLIKAIVDRIFAEEAVGGLLTPMRFQAAAVRSAREAERAAASNSSSTTNGGRSGSGK